MLRKPVLVAPRTLQTNASPAPATTGLRKAPLSAPSPSSAPAGQEDGFDRARRLKAETDRQAELRKNKPFGFRMNVGEVYPADNQPGIPIILTDKQALPSLPFFHYMHRWGYQENVKGSGQEEICIQDDPNGCPMCASLGRKGGYEMVLSCIDGRPFTPKQGPRANQTIPRSRKIVDVKQAMIGKLERIYKEHKTFRGLLVRCFRDNSKDTAIGSEWKVIRRLTEEELRKYGELSEPIDYTKAYPRPTADELRARHSLAKGIPGTGGGLGSEDFGGATGDDALPF